MGWGGGIVTSYQTLNYEIDGKISYRGNGTANGFQQVIGYDWMPPYNIASGQKR